MIKNSLKCMVGLHDFNKWKLAKMKRQRTLDIDPLLLKWEPDYGVRTYTVQVQARECNKCGFTQVRDL